VHRMFEVGSTHPNTEKARAAISKAATSGEDIDLTTYTGTASEQPYQADPTQLPEDTKQRLLEVGVVLDTDAKRAGTFVQIDNTPVHSSSRQEGIEVMPVNYALDKYDWMSDYWWNAVPVDTDKYTANVELNQRSGYFMRALPGYKTIYPVQSCLYLTQTNLTQNIHNIIIAEEDSELHIISGCASPSGDRVGLHLGVSEIYIKEGAKVTFTMIHNWTSSIAVRPRTGILVGKDGVFLSNYIIMKPVHSLQMNPVARCIGENAVVRFNSILLALPGSSMDVGSTVILDARRSRAEVISRAITTGGKIVARGYIEGNAPDVKGHLECRGLVLQEEGVIHAIPELKGNITGVDLSHEAAVGKIAEEEIEYLMARGLTRNEATATIVRGFLRVNIEGLPPELSAALSRTLEESEKDIM
jgi:uncharacterized protein